MKRRVSGIFGRRFDIITGLESKDEDKDEVRIQGHDNRLKQSDEPLGMESGSGSGLEKDDTTATAMATGLDHLYTQQPRLSALDE